MDHSDSIAWFSIAKIYIYIYIEIDRQRDREIDLTCKISTNKILEKILVYLETPTFFFFSHSVLQSHFRLGAYLSPTHL